MSWVVPLALGGLAVLVMAVFTVLSARNRHRAAAQPAPVAGPRILVHDINDDRCTGCDACVAVCPTNVLDLVGNKSRVLRFQDCIQCEACMFACPTEALVMFPEGSVPPPLKIPEIDENYQTAIPGQYLIGEVAGKPLVKNAANLGRAVVEHALACGMRAGALGRGDGTTKHVDVAIVGSGPGGLSAALTCHQRGLSYVVLEKEQLIASTIARYPKGKLVMAEPYDTVNLSLLPVFDSGKEQLIPIWTELIDRVGITVRQGESVESVARGGDGTFEVRSTVATYRAQKVVLSIGTRGKPRTLQVPGENLPKIFSLLEDPDEWRGRSVLVVGGGDSACEAALALADAGAKVMISYRGKGFGRAAPKNKQAIEAYAAEGRIKAKLGSQVLAFEHDSVAIALGDGSQKRYPNDAAFVLIGADPPVQWLEKMGVRFVERPHQHQMGKSDDVVRRWVPRAVECPEDAARAAAQVLGGSVGPSSAKIAAIAAGANLPMPMGRDPEVSGPRKWLRSATSIFSNKPATNPGIPTSERSNVQTGSRGAVPQKKKFESPVPLSEFARRGKSHSTHTGDGRRDSLSSGERTRILRMLRDEGGRLADEDSQVYIGAAPAASAFDFDFDNDSPAPAPAPAPSAQLPDVPAKPAVVVGLAQAQSKKGNKSRAQPATRPPPPLPLPGTSSARPPPLPGVISSAPPPIPGSHASGGRRAVPAPFNDEPTRQVDDNILMALRSSREAGGSPAPTPVTSPKPAQHHTQRGSASPPPKKRSVPPPFDGEATRMAKSPYHVDRVDAGDPFDEATRQADEFKFLPYAPPTEPNVHGLVEDQRDDNEATRLSNIHAIAKLERARSGDSGPTTDERTRAVNIRNDPSISDIDWDLD